MSVRFIRETKDPTHKDVLKSSYWSHRQNGLIALFPYLSGQLWLKDLPGPRLISHRCSECLDPLRAAAALCRGSRNSILPPGYRDYLLVSVASAWCRHKHTLHTSFSFKKKKERKRKEKKRSKALQQRTFSRVR